MQTTLKDADPHDIFAIEPDFTPPPRASAPAPTLAPAGVGPSEHREPHFGPSAAVAPSAAPVPPVAPAQAFAPMYRAAATDDIRLDDIQLGRAPRPTNRWAIRAFWFVFAIISAMGAAAWQHYGDRARQLAAEWTPRIEMLSSLLPGKSASAPEQASTPTDQTAAPDQSAAQPTPAAPSQDVAAATPAPPAAPAPAAAPAVATPVAAVAPAATATAAPDQSQLLQSVARDVASMGQQIAQLKASIDQLKASQDQLAQRVARTTETRMVEPRAEPRVEPRPVPPHPRAVTASPRAAVVPPPAIRRPAQAYIPPPPTSAAPLPAVSAPAQQTVAPLPLQSQPAVVDADDDGPVVRPPMPVR